MHINAYLFIFWKCVFAHIFCMFMQMVFLHILAYFQFAYFSIFTIIMPSKANQINRYSNCGWSATLALLLSPAFSSYRSQLQSSSYASERPKGRWYCLGQGCIQRCWTVESDAAAGTWSWFPHPSCSNVLHVFAEPLLHLVVVIMCNLPECVHFAPELRVLSLVQQGALLIQSIGGRSQSCCLIYKLP